jgi:hypothetical protein
MNKIDLIIDALDKVINACNLYNRQDIQDGGTVYLEEELQASIKALAAAHELKSLKPVAFCALTPNGMMGYFDGKLMIMVGKIGNDCHTTPLYALDEVTK